jgi:hypothetical protein
MYPGAGECLLPVGRGGDPRDPRVGAGLKGRRAVAVCASVQLQYAAGERERNGGWPAPDPTV